MKILICCCVTLLLTRAADASTITLRDFTGSGATFQQNVVMTSSGQLMPDGSGLVRIGYFLNFDPLDPGFFARLACPPGPLLSYINSNFVPLGEGSPALGSVVGLPLGFTTRTVNGISQPGRLFGTITGVTPTAAPPNTLEPGGVPAGSRLFLLIFDQATPGMSTAFGLYSATTWLMPSNPSFNFPLATPAVDTYPEVFLGNLGLTLSVCIPEPGTATLSLAAAGAWLSRRRSRPA